MRILNLSFSRNKTRSKILTVLSGILFPLFSSGQLPQYNIKISGFVIDAFFTYPGNLVFVPDGQSVVDSFGQIDCMKLNLNFLSGEKIHVLKANCKDSIQVNGFLLYPADLLLNSAEYQDIFIDSEPIFWKFPNEKGCSVFSFSTLNSLKNGKPMKTVCSLKEGKIILKLEPF